MTRAHLVGPTSETAGPSGGRLFLLLAGAGAGAFGFHCGCFLILSSLITPTATKNKKERKKEKKNSYNCNKKNSFFVSQISDRVYCRITRQSKGSSSELLRITSSLSLSLKSQSHHRIVLCSFFD